MVFEELIENFTKFCRNIEIKQRKKIIKIIYNEIFKKFSILIFPKEKKSFF